MPLDPTNRAADANPPIDARPSRRGLPSRYLAAGLACAAVLSLIIFALAKDEDPVEEATAVAEQPTPTPATRPSSTPSAEPTLVATNVPTTNSVPTTDPVPAAEPAEAIPVSANDCLRTGGPVETPAERATATIRNMIVEADDPRCFGQDLADLRGGIYWMPLTDGPRASGGALAIEREADTFDVVTLSIGPWNSYQRIGGSDGANAPVIAGLPSGKINPERGGFSLEVDGDAYLYGQSEDSTFYWLSQPIFDSWLANGGHTSPLRTPASSLYEIDGVDRVDFEGGYITHVPGEVPKVNSIGTDPAFLPPNPELRGRLISARDGTSWFVDRQDRRWWIPDVQAWFCAGGDANRVAEDRPGYSIHRLAHAGVAPCPLGLTGTHPVTGGVEMQVYCQTEVSADSTAVEVADGWSCETSTDQIRVDHAAVCVWQYGDGARIENESPPTAWSCSASP